MRLRPAVLLAALFGAGLATGLAHFGDDRAVAVVLGTIALLSTRLLPAAAPRVGFWALVVLLGRLSGVLAVSAAAERCAARLPAARVALRVALEEPADSAGGVLEVRPLYAECRGSILARWPTGRPLAAGMQARVSGRWIPRPVRFGPPDGILVTSAVEPTGGAPGLADALRTWIQETSHRLYGRRAGVVDALILNRRAAMAPELRERYAESGLVHILSISGFHVGLIAAWVVLVGSACGARRVRIRFLAALIAAAYVGFLGWPAPATRAAALVLLLALSFARQRQVEPNSLLAVTCLAVLLLDPWAVFDLGAWLSAASLWGATTASRWSDRALGSRAWWRMLASSVGATVAAAPLTALAFGTVALAGIGVNFLAIPLAAVAVPGVLASLLAAPLSHALSGALAAGSGLALEGLDAVAAAGAAIPGGHLVCPAEASAALPWMGVLGLALWGVRGGTTPVEALRRWALAAAVLSWATGAAVFGARLRDNRSDLALHFLDVGQGDAAAIRTPGGHWVLIDAGPRTDRADAGRRIVAPFLARQGVRALAVAIVSHAHADHLGGIPAVLERIPPSLVLEPGEYVSDPLYLGFLDQLAADGVPWRAGRPGDRFELDGVHFTLLHPDTAWTEWRNDLNEDSIVLLVEYAGFRALFDGDAGLKAEVRLRGHVGRVDLLKVGHHGSCTASGDPWLAETEPRVAVVSVGAINRYGHPCPATLARLSAHGASVWRTDREGTVTVHTDGHILTVEGRRGEEQYPVAGAGP